jgi:hypothetical protein
MRETNMNLRGILTTGVATSAAVLSMVAMAPGAGAAPAAPTDANVLSCTTTTPDGRTGIADCTNNTNRTIAFHVHVVCGWAPDQDGPWKTLNPGARDTSAATCPWSSSGVGSVNWVEG